MTPGAPCGPPTPPVMGSAATSACSTAASLCCTPPTPQRCLAEQHPQGTRELHPRAAERPEPCDVWPSTLGHRHESSSRCGCGGDSEVNQYRRKAQEQEHLHSWRMNQLDRTTTKCSTCYVYMKRYARCK
ncbi:hypothetical protein B296_00008678 [Ensete ventricosum]|uniref:Uncharacterized protein n=1 Tax=Ensete ventricosum TaxID=4639 RepID=A0A427B5S7_ENSVE|nr:hypothetical protein B296_00008678 [Ensete ventricosum]